MPLIGPVRFSFLNVFEPRAMPNSDDKKYSVCCMIPQSDKKLMNAVQSDIQEAVKVSLENNKFPKSKVPMLKYPLRDGTAECKTGQRGAEFDGFSFFNCTSKNMPGIVDADRNPILDPNEFWSGCWGYVDVNFFGYNTSGNVGIGVGLNNIMKWKEDERLDGRKSADAAFADVPAPPASDGEMS